MKIINKISNIVIGINQVFYKFKITNNTISFDNLTEKADAYYNRITNTVLNISILSLLININYQYSITYFICSFSIYLYLIFSIRFTLKGYWNLHNPNI
jgi:hypothetical protein